MEELIKALGHINFYLADADEIFGGRKERVSEDYCLLYDGQAVGYKDKWFTKFRNCYVASVIPSGQL